MIKRKFINAVDEWRRHGAVVVKDIFSQKEIISVQEDIEKVFGYKRGSLPTIKNQQEYTTNEKQFLNFENIPFECSPFLNLIGVHPYLIDFAKEALNTSNVILYQSQAWAKYAGETDFEQSFHCDYGNHTLTVPSSDMTDNSITFLMYFSDVSEEHGPAHYVRRGDSEKINKIAEKFLSGVDSNALQQSLKPYERTTAGPSGTIFAYGIDIFHRATNITKPGAHRYAVTSCFKKAENDKIGFTAWPYHQHKPWRIIFENGSPEQLNCFGVPLPGDPFWSKDTIRLANLRYPGWNMAEYKKKMVTN